MAIHDDEVAAGAVGINTGNMKLLAFGIGASLGGVAGAMFGTFQGFVSPEAFGILRPLLTSLAPAHGKSPRQVG
jgi:branched-chain amino acid transport system permease protein